MNKLKVLMAVLISLALCSCAGGDIMSKAKVGDVSGIKQSLDKGVSIESKYERSEQTVLIVAARNNRVSAVEYLCEQGANVNAQDIYGSTALHQAIFYDYEKVVKVLLKYNADKDIKDHKGYTALDYATQYDYDEIIEMLHDAPPGESSQKVAPQDLGEEDLQINRDAASGIQ